MKLRAAENVETVNNTGKYCTEALICTVLGFHPQNGKVESLVPRSSRNASQNWLRKQ